MPRAAGNMRFLSASLAPWGRIASILTVIATVCVFYWPAMVVLKHVRGTMSDPTYTHGYLIVAICLWLLVRERFRIAAAPIYPQPLIALFLLVAGLAWLVAYRSAIQVG